MFVGKAADSTRITISANTLTPHCQETPGLLFVTSTDPDLSGERRGLLSKQISPLRPAKDRRAYGRNDQRLPDGPVSFTYNLDVHPVSTSGWNPVDGWSVRVYPAYMSWPVPSGVLAVLIAQGRSRRAALVDLRADAAPAAESVGCGAASAAADADDVRKSRQGDSEAYRRLIERCQSHTAKILWRFTRDKRVHEELVQDVFVEAYLSLGGYRGRAPFESWLSRIATRVGYRYWRQTARRKASQSWSLEEWDKLPDSEQSMKATEPAHAGELLHRLLQQLPPRDRLVLTLRYLDDCDVYETARRTGWTKTMVKVQTMRARRKLKKLFDRSKESVE